MADMVTVQELENAKIDARTIGESVNENKIVTPRYGAPFKSMPMIAEEMQSIIGTIIAGGVPDSVVINENGETQEKINNQGGATWYQKSGGYALNDRVILENGDILRSIIANNTNTPSLNLIGWFNTSKSGGIVDTRKYGVYVGTVFDMTQAIHDAISDNPTAVRFYIPSGTIYANIVVPRSYIQFIGDGLGVTRIIGFDGTKPTIGFNKKLYMSLKDISVFQKYEATASVVNARDSRYIITESAEIFQLPNDLDEYSYSVRGLDLRKDTVSWTGYNYFKESRFNRCLNGVDIDTTGDVASVIKWDNCVLSFNGYFGAKIVGVEVGGMNNCDIATNGQIGMRDGIYDEEQFGGVYVKGKFFKITGAWHELNHGKFGFPEGSDYPNDLYIHPDSVNVTETDPRSQRSLSGGYLLTESQASQSNNGYSDTIIDTGMGVSKHQNLLSNGDFKYSLTNWLNANITGADWSLNSDDCPKGFERVLRLNSTGGVKSLYQKIYEGGQTGNIIDNLTQHIGKTISITCWVKNIGSTISNVRVGFDTGAVGTNVYFSTGTFINNTPLNKWVQVVLTHKIKGDEGRLFAGIRTTGDVLICGFNCQFGSRVAAYEPKRITEEGGKIIGELDVVSLKRSGVVVATVDDVSASIKFRAASNATIISVASSINTDKRHPSFVFNSTNGKAYYSTGSLATSVWRATDGSGDLTPV